VRHTDAHHRKPLQFRWLVVVGVDVAISIRSPFLRCSVLKTVFSV